MSDLEQLVAQVFGDQVGHDVVLSAEDAGLLDGLWSTVTGLGLTDVGIAEAAGGSGGTLADVVTVLRAAGQHAVPLPLLEHHLALWLVTSAGGAVDGGPWTVAESGDDLAVGASGVTGRLRDVAWGRAAAKVVAIADGLLVVVDRSTAEVREGRDLAGHPRDDLILDDADAQVLDCPVTADQLRQRGAVLRAAQMAGAMQAVYDVTNTYVYQREQFGRPVGTFQAVRTHLVQLAQVAVMTQVSVDRAAAALERGEEASFASYAVKLLANQNAALSIRSGHQAHGAIGMTREYVLQDLTRRLNAWRGGWGTERALSERLGRAVAGAGRVATVATDPGSLTV